MVLENTVELTGGLSGIEHSGGSEVAYLTSISV